MIETKNKKANSQATGWRAWKPVWTGRRHATPHDCQENHSPTEPVYVQTTQTRKTQRSTRRILDARLWESLTLPQQDAAIEIAAAAHLATKGAGFRTSPYSMQRLGPSATSETERQAALIAFYFSWARECKQARISHACALDILLFGKSCRQVDKERRMRNGAARGNLVEVLKLYCKLRGWPYE